MGIGVSIFLIALGAILAFAVDAQVSGLDVRAVGWILMVLGVIGLILTLIFWSRNREVGVADEAGYGTRGYRTRGYGSRVRRTRGRVVERDVYDDPYDDRPPL